MNSRPGVSRAFLLMISISLAIAIFAWAAAFVAIYSE
jgi:hypothetical protein